MTRDNRQSTSLSFLDLLLMVQKFRHVARKSPSYVAEVRSAVPNLHGSGN